MQVIADSMTVAALLHVLVGVAVIGMTYFLGTRVFGGEVGLVAAWWLAIDPLHIVDSSVLLTEVVFSAFLTGAVLTLSAQILEQKPTLSWGRWAVAGLLVAAAALIRPIGLYLPLAAVLTAVVFRRRKLIVGTLVLLAAFSVPVGIWVVRNASLTGVITFSTIQGENLSNYRAAGAVAAQEGISLTAARERIGREVAAETEADMNPAEIDAIRTRVGINQLLDHPVGYAITAARGLFLTLGGPASSHIEERTQGTPLETVTPFFVVGAASSAIAMSLAAAFGASRQIARHHWRELALIGLPIVYLLVVGSGHEAWARFRIPFQPLLVVVAALGVIEIKTLLGAGSTVVD